MQWVVFIWYEQKLSIECTRSLGGDKIFNWISYAYMLHTIIDLDCSALSKNLSHSFFNLMFLSAFQQRTFLRWRHMSSIIIHHHIRRDKIVLSWLCVHSCLGGCVCVVCRSGCKCICMCVFNVWMCVYGWVRDRVRDCVRLGAFGCVSLCEHLTWKDLFSFKM